MELLLPGRIEGVATAYGYVRTVFDQVASGERGPTVSITPSIRHVGVTRRDTFRPGFSDAVRASREEGYPVLVRGAGGGATAAHYGTFGFSIIRPTDSTHPAQDAVGALAASGLFNGQSADFVAAATALAQAADAAGHRH
jgi:lipoate-protein ligase A